MRRFRRVAAPMLVVLALGLAGCGDDGADVRNLGEDGEGTGTGGTGTESTGTEGTGTGATGTEATGTEPTGTEATGTGAGAECHPVGEPEEADTTVDVTLTEWSVEPDPAEAPAGTVAFDASNEGGTAHELVVVRADSAEELPTDEEGALDEEALRDKDLIGEISSFPAGEDCAGAFDLEPGDYVLLCDVADGTSHFHEGMHAEFTVTG